MVTSSVLVSKKCPGRQRMSVMEQNDCFSSNAPTFVLVFYSLIFRPAQGRKPNAEPGSRNEKNKRILFQDGKLLASLRGSFTSYTQFLLHPRSSLHSPSIHLQNTSLPPTFPPSFLPQLMLLHSSYVIWNNQTVFKDSYYSFGGP